MRLDIGCGEDKRKGYDGLDIYNYGQKYVGDALALLPDIPDERYERVEAHHFVEHFKWDDISVMLEDIHRILKPDGILEIEVPNGTDPSQFRPYHYALYSLESWDWLNSDRDWKHKFHLVQKYKGKYGHLTFKFKKL